MALSFLSLALWKREYEYEYEHEHEHESFFYFTLPDTGARREYQFNST